MCKERKVCGTYERALEKAAAYANRRGSMSDHARLVVAEEFLYRAGWVLFGIETCKLEGGERSMEYLNSGDTYSATVAVEDGKVFVTTWGDWYEAAEAEYCKENSVLRCGDCGKFTPDVEGVDWHEVVCEHCGRLVSGGIPPGCIFSGFGF